MNLACKNAILRRDVAHLIFPDEVQTLPGARGLEAGGPEGRITPLGHHPATGVAGGGEQPLEGRSAR